MKQNPNQRKPKREGPLQTTILGLREHIFTGSVSSLANYMALQEISFVTLGQRVLARPLHIRLHYGHPDVFDKLFFITRGGVSKASKGINLSEDIFAGYNSVNRGGSVAFKEYVQVGKGRDVGMRQIFQFEAKLSQGAAEQSLSRDVYRMCNRLDFCRLLSFYYGGIGHYFSNVLTVLTVFVVTYLMLTLAIFDLEQIGDRLITPMGTIQMLLGGLGLLQTIPLFATLGVERGWVASMQEILLVFVTGGPLHFMFHIQTKANYMAQTIFVGGAKYRPTGRGFVTQHTPMDEQFRFFASSHLYLGLELAAALILMGIFTDAGQYFGRTWSLWLASVSFISSPFWFNPLTFDWNVVVNDYELWIRWIRGSSGGSNKSWSMWWNEETAIYKKLRFSSKLFYSIRPAIHVMVAVGIWGSSLFNFDTTLDKPSIPVHNLLIFIVVILVTSEIFSVYESRMPYPIRRTIGILLVLGLIAGVFTLFIEDMNYIRYTLASYYGIGALCQLGLMFGFHKLVKPFFCIHDVIAGHVIFVPLFVLAALQIPAMIQTWLLYHNALSTDVVVSDILRYARKTQESGGGNAEDNEDLMEQIHELRKVIHRQEQVMVQNGLMRQDESGMPVPTTPIGGSGGDLFGPSTPGPTTPGGGVGGFSEAARPANPAPSLSSARTFSMSGLDVYGTMALGDVPNSGESSMMDFRASAPNLMPMDAQTIQGFSFTQPADMPPR